MPRNWIPPQLATLVAEAPDGPDWLHEIKFDGYRLLAYIDGGDVRLLTRNRNDWTDRFPSVSVALGRLGLEDCVLDGEVAVEIEGGATSFQALQNVLTDSQRGPLRFFVFDVLRRAGRDLRSEPLISRKTELAELLSESESVLRYSDHVEGNGPAFLAEACAHGLEGIISKRASAPYRSGRGRDWLKVKCQRSQEFVIGGFTEPAGSRVGLGALHLGTYEDGELIYRGKVGTGFSDAVLWDIRRRLERIERSTTPFSAVPRGTAGRSAHWVRPELVAQVRYTDVTTDGRLRHPAFEGLREDKPAREVRMEKPAAKKTTRKARTKPKPRNEASARKPTRKETKPRKKATGRKTPRTKDRTTARRPSATRRTGSRSDAIEIAGVRLTSPEKVLYPEQGLTKLDLANYYRSVADWMVPHIAGRPLTLVRCPSGRGKGCFFQKHLDDSAPAAIERVRVEEKDGSAWYGAVDSAEGLVSLAQMGALELHTFNVRADRLEKPDRFLIDLDPDRGVAWDQVVETAHAVRAALDELGLVSFLKTTGGKGLHIVVPIVRRAEWDEVRQFSRAVASLLVAAAPDRYTIEMSKAKRKGRVLLDYVRNARGATAVEAYSTRARPGAPVAAPITWDELDSGIRSDGIGVQDMVRRMKRLKDDPWKEIGTVRQSLTGPMKRRLGL